MKLTVTPLPPTKNGAYVTIFKSDEMYAEFVITWKAEETLQQAIDTVVASEPECVSFEFVIQVVR